MLPLQLLGLRQRAGVHHAGIQHGLTITDPAQHLEKTDGEKQDCETAQDCTSESPPPVTDGFFFFFFPQLNVWAPLCRMMRVQGLTLICDITDNLESNCGPIFSRHRCDVETCEVEHLLCLAVTFWICKKKKKCAYSYILDFLVTVTEKVPFNISMITANKLYPFHPKPCQTQIWEFLSLPQHTRGVDPDS